MKQTVVLTGAGGFLGSEIAGVLAADGEFDLVGVSRPGGRPADACHRVLQLDLADEATVVGTLAELRPYAIVHAAGRVQGSAVELFRDNVVTTVNLADAIYRVAPDCRLVVLGSAAAYGPPSLPGPIAEDAPHAPVSTYGHSKLAASRYIVSAHDRHGLRYDDLIVFNVVGERNSPAQAIGGFIANAAAQVRAGAPASVRMGPLAAVRDFVTANDVAQVVRRVLEREPRNAPMNVCSGYGRCVRDLIRLLIEEAGRPIELEETQSPDSGGVPDIVVGDPRLCLATLAPRQLSSVDETLRRAWHLAIGGSP